MVQNGTWQWLLEGFKFDLEAVVKPKTLEYYLTPIQLFARWAENGAQITAPGLVSKRDLQRFFYDLIQDSGAAHADGSGKRRVRRTERSKWHYYRALRRFFSWAVKEGYLEQNPIAFFPVLRYPFRRRLLSHLSGAVSFQLLCNSHTYIVAEKEAPFLSVLPNLANPLRIFRDEAIL